MFNKLRPAWNNACLLLKHTVRIFKDIFEKKFTFSLQHAVMSKPMMRKLNPWHVRHLRRVATIKHSFWSHMPNSTVKKRTHTYPISASVHKQQAIYMGHVLRADPDNHIRFVMYNDPMQARTFYSVSKARRGRPLPKWPDEVTNLLLQNAVICAKTFLTKHPALRQTSKNIQDLYNIAKDRVAFKALAHSLVIKAKRELPDIDFEDPTPLD